MIPVIPEKKNKMKRIGQINTNLSDSFHYNQSFV